MAKQLDLDYQSVIAGNKTSSIMSVQIHSNTTLTRTVPNRNSPDFLCFSKLFNDKYVDKANIHPAACGEVA